MHPLKYYWFYIWIVAFENISNLITSDHIEFIYMDNIHAYNMSTYTSYSPCFLYYRFSCQDNNFWNFNFMHSNWFEEYFAVAFTIVVVSLFLTILTQFISSLVMSVILHNNNTKKKIFKLLCIWAQNKGNKKKERKCCIIASNISDFMLMDFLFFCFC